MVRRQISGGAAAYFCLLLYSKFTYVPFCLQTDICKRRNSFAILSYLFSISANKLSYEQFTKELRKNYLFIFFSAQGTQFPRAEIYLFIYLFISMTEHIRLQCNITAGQQGTNK